MNLLIDGSSLLWRTHYSNKARNVVGVSANMHLFLTSIKSFVKMYNTKDVYIAWDKRLVNEDNFRQQQENVEYKGGRNKEEAQDVYAAQPLIHELTEAIGCKNLYPRIMEADDVIAWLSQTLEGQNIIVTTDGDMLQLINKRTSVYNPRKKIIYDNNNFERELGMPIEHYLPYKAIMGDSSDNIKGIDGYGKVYSKRLAKTWIETPEEVDKDKTEIIERNMELMNLCIGFIKAGDEEVQAYSEQLSNYKPLEPDFDKFIKICEEHNINSFIKNVSEWERLFKPSPILEIFKDMDF